MRIGSSLAVLLCWIGGAVASPSLDRIVAAHGGREALSAIERYAAKLTLTDIWVDQNPTPGPPWRTSQGVRCHALDLTEGRVATYERRMAAGFYPFHGARWLDGESTRRFNLYDGWRTTRQDGSAARRAITEALVFAPAPLVAAMLGEPEKVTTLAPERGPDSRRVRFRFAPGTGEPMELAFDARTRMLRTLKTGERTVHYDGFEIVDGYPVSRRMKMEWRGDTVWRLHLSRAVFNGAFAATPDALAELPDVTTDAPEDPRRFRVRELDPGVYLVGGGATYQLFVEFRDFVVALGGVRGVAKRLQALRSVAGDKPLRYALITHHHADHLEGVPALVDAGAVLVISPAHEKAVRRAAGPGRRPSFAHVADRREITDGEQRLVFLALGPMRHADNMLGAWLPDAALLFTADLFVQPPGRPVRAGNPPIRDLADAVERLDLDATRFVDTHTPVVSNLADLRLAVKKEGNWSGFDDVSRAVCPP